MSPKYIFKCEECNEYALSNEKSKCKRCGGRLVNTKPAKFSLIDKYGKYRLPYFKEKFAKYFE